LGGGGKEGVLGKGGGGIGLQYLASKKYNTVPWEEKRVWRLKKREKERKRGKEKL